MKVGVSFVGKSMDLLKIYEPEDGVYVINGDDAHGNFGSHYTFNNHSEFVFDTKKIYSKIRGGYCCVEEVVGSEKLGVGSWESEGGSWACDSKIKTHF